MPQDGQSLVDELDAQATATLGAPYAALSVAAKAGLWKVVGDSMVAWFGGTPAVAWKTVDLVGGDFGFLANVSTSVNALPDTAALAARYRGGFALLRGGVDNMIFVEGMPNATAEWTINAQNHVVIFGDVTLEGITYRVRYMTPV